MAVGGFCRSLVVCRALFIFCFLFLVRLFVVSCLSVPARFFLLPFFLPPFFSFLLLFLSSFLPSCILILCCFSPAASFPSSVDSLLFDISQVLLASCFFYCPSAPLLVRGLSCVRLFVSPPFFLFCFFCVCFSLVRACSRLSVCSCLFLRVCARSCLFVPVCVYVPRQSQAAVPCRAYVRVWLRRRVSLKNERGAHVGIHPRPLSENTRVRRSLPARDFASHYRDLPLRRLRPHGSLILPRHGI